MTTHAITMTVRTRTGAPPRVRFVRSDVVRGGAISVSMAGADVLVTYGVGTVVDADGLEGGSGSGDPPELVLSDGEMELCVRGYAAPPIPPAPATPTVRMAAEAEWQPAEDTHRVVSLKPLVRTLPMLVQAPAAPESTRTELPAPRPPPRSRTAFDSPTRVQPIAEILAAPDAPRPAPQPPRASTQTPRPVSVSVPMASPNASPDRRRMLIRRVALLSMLLCAFALAMHAKRLHRRRARSAPETAAATSPMPSATPVALPPPPVQPVRLTPITGATASVGPRARQAADALANGAYADALHTYEDLARDPEANPAYARAAHILGSRLSKDSSSPKP